MKRILLIAAIVSCSLAATAKNGKTVKKVEVQPVADPALIYSNSFESVQKPDTAAFKDHCLVYRYVPVLCEGIEGKAYDLTDDTPVRLPFVLTEEQTPDYTKSFSFAVWVQTKPGAKMGTPIMGNKKNNDFLPIAHSEYRHVIDDPWHQEDQMPGWLIGTTEAGAWYFYVNDSTHRYIYYPTPERQKINDGKWHFIAGNVNLEAKELWLYFDGKNVAIYNIEELENAVSSTKTVVGGSYEYVEGMPFWDTRGSWMTFNGRMDEARLWNRSITPEEVRTEYLKYFPQAKKDICPPEATPSSLKVLSWNIWHGGRRYGEFVGLERVIDVMKRENADIIGIVETYGSGAQIADALGYYYYLISDNLSVMTKFPIDSVFTLYKSFKFGGAMLDMGEGHKLCLYDIWLDWRGAKYLRADSDSLVAAKWPEFIREHNDIPMIGTGDYNTRSHLDYSESDPIYKDMVFDNWPTRFIENLGFKDSYRDLHPDVKKYPGPTYALAVAGAGQQNQVNRIDYIYYRGKELVPFFSDVISHHPVMWPSDHCAVVTHFYLNYDK